MAMDNQAPTPQSPRKDSADVSNAEIADFYDDFSQKLVKGFVTGNPRIDHALNFVFEQMPRDAQSLLEIGCGVGETTQRLSKSNQGMRTVGVDISPQNIETARRLFGADDQAKFSVSDLTSPVEGGPFEVVTLLDVYEHIPATERPRFHANLLQSMSPGARLIVTCPSYLHQNHLYQNEPQGLQIVDETIGPQELLQLATDLGGQLSHLHYESVWRTNDYIYAVVDRQMSYQWKSKPTGLERWSRKLNRFLNKTPIGGPARRKRYVKRRLAA